MGEKSYGFPVLRRRERRYSWPWFFVVALVGSLLWILGAMPVWPQSSAQLSKSSSGPSETWEALSNQFDSLLQTHEETLKSLSNKLTTSESGRQQLTSSLAQLSRQNNDLKTYNDQIGQRMQQRDEDLATAYQKISILEKQMKGLIVTVIIESLLLLAAVVFTIWKIAR
jgi:septal ring factor EnvC (AmiA/AmiB activator)